MNALRGGVLRDTYALIYQIGLKGVVSISADYISERLGYSYRGVQNAIIQLKKMGWLEIEYTEGKRSVFKTITPEQNTPQKDTQNTAQTHTQNAEVTHTQRVGVDPHTECVPPTHRMCDPHAQNVWVTPIISSDIDLDYSSSTPAGAHARDRLQKWVEESLQEWIEILLSRENFKTPSLQQLLDDFYNNDFKVRERCERNERQEVLSHLQNWLPKFITKLRNQHNDDNNQNNNANNQNSPNNADSRYRRDNGRNGETGDRTKTKPYSRVSKLANARFDI